MIESPIRVGYADPDGTLPPGDATILPATLLGGRYRIERVIGEGAFGRVFLAFDTRLHDQVAIKELLAARNTTVHPTYDRYLARFQREARAARGSKHPNTVTVYDLYVDDAGNNYLVMEYVDGKNLRDLLSQVGTLPVERAVAITLDVARALEAIHEQAIVHRDIKPANIMIARRGNAKLTDFGVALVASDANTTITPDGHPGTVPYMSPEQASGYGFLDGRSDVYSLGLVLYEMLVGKPYAAIRQPLAAMRPDLPAPLIAIVDGMMQRNLARRSPSAAAVAAELQRFASTPVAPPEPPRPPELTPAAPVLPPFVPYAQPQLEPQPDRPRGPIFAVVGAATVVALAFALFLAVQPRPPAPVPPTPTAVRPTVAPTTAPPTAVPPTTLPPTISPVRGTTPWTDAKGRVRLQIPNGWAASLNSADSNNVLELRGPDGAFFSVRIFDPAFGTLDQETQDFLNAHTTDKDYTYRDGPVRDIQIGRESAKTFAFTSTAKADGTQTDGAIWEVNHGRTEFQFQAAAIGTHRAELDAIIASVTFLK